MAEEEDLSKLYGTTDAAGALPAAANPAAGMFLAIQHFHSALIFFFLYLFFY